MLISFIGVFASETYSQTTKLSLKVEKMSLEEFLIEIENQSEFRFFYAGKIDVNKKVSGEYKNEEITEILDDIKVKAGIKYEVMGRQIVLSPIDKDKVIKSLQQQKSISGRVKDVSGEPLPGVAVVINGTTKGTITDMDGNYTIPNVSGETVLVFSFVGMKKQKIVVGNQSNINIILEPDAIALDEVVAIGYGTVKKSDLTGAVTSVGSEEIAAFPTTNIVQALQGRSSGVVVKQNSGSPGDAISVRIRGTNSIQGGNEPLYVIDGFPSSSSKPTVLDNSNIESIEVLKDASSVAIYGSRGANGVVLITTKKGKAGKPTVSYDASVGFQSLRKKLDMMNATEYASFYNLQRVNDGLSPYFSDEEINTLGEGFDWQDFVFSTSPIQSHAITVCGGNDKTKFSIMGNMFNQDGIIEGSGYGRYSITANIDQKLSDKITVNYSSTLAKTKLDNKNWGGERFGASLISAALCAPPSLTAYNDDGSCRVLRTAYPFVSEGLTNPVNYINEISDVRKSNEILANINFIYKPIKDLTVKIHGGIENSDDRNDYYKTVKYVDSQGYASIGSYQSTSYLNENTINYEKSIGKHDFSVLGGFTYQNFKTTSIGGSGSGFLSDNTKTGNLSSASIPGIPSSGYTKSVILSGLGRLNYVYDNRYLVTVNMRADGSSKYSKGSKWGYFPSGAIAWKIKEENFMQDVEEISNLKLRASYGVTGSQAISAYATLNNLYSGKTVFGDALNTTFAPGSRLPGDLKWETTTQYDVGVDLGIMNNRYNFSIDYYHKRTDDLLNTVSLPLSSGFSSTIKNIGVIQNQGLELSFDGNLLQGDFSWDMDGNISFNKSKVKELYGGKDIYGGWQDMLVIADNLTLLREGEPMSVFYGYLKNGYDDEGFEAYKDLNTDGVIDENDKTIIGDPNADFVYALNSHMSFKCFELSLFFQGSQGNDIANIGAVGNNITYGYGTNQLEEVYTDHWTPENTNAKYPKITREQKMQFSDRQIEDGSYLRLRDIQFAYNLPLSVLNSSCFEKIKIYFSAQNYLTITKYSGWDPEVNSLGGSSSIAQGIDHYSYPTAKTLTFGINVTFK